jgi:hypothetical protein
MVLGYKVFLDDEPVNLPGIDQPVNPSEAIDSAKDAAEQSQNAQEQINQKAQEQIGY